MTITRTSSRDIQAAQLRAQGLTYNAIAQQLRLNSGGHARWCATRGAALLASQQGPTSWLDRQFGVEIEHTSVSTHTSAAALQSLGLDARPTNYTHRVVSYWKMTTDASCGYEAVSPILKGDDGFRSLRTAMKGLRNAGATVNNGCGMHVHVDMTGMDGEAIARLVTLYTDFQDEIDMMLPPSRRQNGYCPRWRRDERDMVVAAFASTRRPPAGWSNAQRYRSLNVMSFPLYGTIEFRQHEGTLNGSQASAWVKFCLALVEIARTDRVGSLVHGAGFVASVLALVPDMPGNAAGHLLARTSAPVSV